MTAPIRPLLFSLTDRKDITTLRDAVSWYKEVWRGTEPLGMLTARETQFVNEQWGVICRELADQQKVPAGMLSYWLDELAMNEIQLAETAEDESQAALEYGSQ